MRVWIALLTVLVLASVACARPKRVPDSIQGKLDTSLRRLAESGADTVTGVFIRTTRPVGPSEREQLQRAGARIGTVTGAILTARVAARDLRRVAALPFVEYVEAAALLGPTGALVSPVPPTLPFNGVE